MLGWGTLVVLFGVVAQCNLPHPHGSPFLPTRSEDAYTNWGQGKTPVDNVCPPGTFRFETDDGLFLECYNGGRQ